MFKFSPHRCLMAIALSGASAVAGAQQPNDPIISAGETFVPAGESADIPDLGVAQRSTGERSWSGSDAGVRERGSDSVVRERDSDAGVRERDSDAGVRERGSDAAAVVDRVGKPGFDPGTEWVTGETGTQNNTLLLSEIAVTPTGAEFIEIYNPNPDPVDLSDVYVSDATFASGGTFYYNLVTGSVSATGGGGFGDFTARFPDSASIPAGAYQVIALAGSDAFFAEFGVDPDYELFEDGTNPDAVADMREALPGSISDQGGLTNSGEVVVLFAWDGIGDLVGDLDYVVWGDQAEAVDKSGVVVDGPDGDSLTSAYAPDTAISAQEVVATGAHPGGDSFQRDDFDEGSETTTGGNGVDGNDETSENLSATWCIAAATPGAPGNCTTLPPLSCSTVTTPIHDVQGPGAVSPRVGDVVEIEGVVVADFANGTPGELGGFFLQEEDADTDGDPLTSEGVFVLTTMLDVVPGDRVRVRGQVEEFFELTRLSNVSDALICDTGRTVTPATVTLPISDPGSLESIEGMAVTLPQTLVVTDIFNLARFGEFTLSHGRLIQPTQTHEPGPAAIAQQTANDLNRLIVDDGRLSTYGTPFPVGRDDTNPLDAGNPVRGGYTVTALQGAMHYTFGSYKIEPGAPIDFDELAAPRTPEPDIADAPLKVAAFNVLNFFTTIDGGVPLCGPSMDRGCRGADSAAELVRQVNKIVPAILALDADIVGLSELENNDSESLQGLVDALNAATAPGTWAFVDAGPIGEDAIKVGLIHTPATVDTVGLPAILDSTVDARFDSVLNRPSLAQTFEHRASGERLTVVVNHLKAKGCSGATGADADQGDGQACFNATRTNAAEALADWLDSDPTGSGDPDYLVLGDLNSYRMEDPIRALTDAGLIDLGAGFDDAEAAYTFQFFGQYGALDYALASPALELQVLDAAHWPINADEQREFDYNEEDLDSTPKPADFFSPDPYRASDHDPVIVSILPGSGVVDALSQDTFVESDREFAAADGLESAIVTIQLVDRSGQPVPDTAVEISVTGSAMLGQASGTTDSSGRFETTLTNTVIEQATIGGLYDANASGTPSTPIVNGGPRRVNFRDATDFLFASGYE